MHTLLTTSNSKTVKGEGLGYVTFVMYMAPHKQNSNGKNLCPAATIGCSTSCLYTAGRGKFSKTKTARIARADYFVNNRELFMMQLVGEIANAVNQHGADKIAIRLNGTSDIPWENIPVYEFDNVMELFPNVQFYDYTKVSNRFSKKLPNNYHLTYSRSETIESNDTMFRLLTEGVNVAAVFSGKLPEEYFGFPVLDGDKHDLRFLNPPGYIIGLSAKGEAKKDTSGFVIKQNDYEPSNTLFTSSTSSLRGGKTKHS